MQTRDTRRAHLMVVTTTELVIFATLTGVAVSAKARQAVAFQLVRLWDYVNHESEIARIPFGDASEKLLITLGSIAFYISRTKALRKYPLNHPDNQSFFQTMFVGVAIGLLMDLSSPTT